MKAAFLTAVLLSLPIPVLAGNCAVRDQGGALVNIITCGPVAAGYSSAPVTQSDLDAWNTAHQPAAVPRALSKVEFVTLTQQAGGMTDTQLVAAKADTNLAAFWIKFELAEPAITKGHPLTQAGLAALIATGYLTQAKVDAINAAWPVQ